MSEPLITINGVRLTDGQAMTVRVAVESFRREMQSVDALGCDAVGRAIAAGYRGRAAEVATMLVEPPAETLPISGWGWYLPRRARAGGGGGER